MSDHEGEIYTDRSKGVIYVHEEIGRYMFIELKQLLRSKNKISHNGKLLSDFDKNDYWILQILLP